LLAVEQPSNEPKDKPDSNPALAKVDDERINLRRDNITA
jgi:hypothetical protein